MSVIEFPGPELAAGDSEFTFDDAWPFQQLFTAVAELCGLKDKMAATGYELPDIGMVEAVPSPRLAFMLSKKNEENNPC
jgi:hypothetical protein